MQTKCPCLLFWLRFLAFVSWECSVANIHRHLNLRKMMGDMLLYSESKTVVLYYTSVQSQCFYSEHFSKRCLNDSWRPTQLLLPAPMSQNFVFSVSHAVSREQENCWLCWSFHSTQVLFGRKWLQLRKVMIKWVCCRFLVTASRGTMGCSAYRARSDNQIEVFEIHGYRNVFPPFLSLPLSCV